MVESNILIRLQKFMAQCGVTSRRKSEELIKAGRVTVNGRIVTEMGIMVNPLEDVIQVDGKTIKKVEPKIYIALNKPKGYVSTAKDQFGRPTVLDLVADVSQYRLYPVGRLDYYTTGLILLTNDGEVAYRLTHPKHEINKVYVAKLKGIPDENDIYKFENGLVIEGRVTAPAKLEIERSYGNGCIAKITLHEGRNRQVRKMCQMIGHPVLELKRQAIGSLTLGTLRPGQWRYLNEKEIEYLKSLR